MYIFIDESGGFQVPSRPHMVSCVSAVIVPESIAPALFRAFSRTIQSWKQGARELKGSQLTEEQMAAVIGTVSRYDVLLMSVGIDMSLHTDELITTHKHGQAAKLLASASPLSPGSKLRELLERWADGFRSLSNQLYVQSVLLSSLVESVINVASLYYVQRIPKTLGAFSWRIDAKDVTVTRYEKLWRETVEPYLQFATLKKPQLHLQGADYSAFLRYAAESSETPEYLRAHLRDPNKNYVWVDSGKLLSDLEFRGSHELVGLQIVDMLSSAVRRACTGTLQRRGWRELGRIMPCPKRGNECVELVALHVPDQPTIRAPETAPYVDVIRSWQPQTRRVVIL